MAVGWIGTSGDVVVVVRRVARRHGLARNAIALGRPRREVDESAPLRAERPMAVVADLRPADGTSSGAHESSLPPDAPAPPAATVRPGPEWRLSPRAARAARRATARRAGSTRRRRAYRRVR